MLNSAPPQYIHTCPYSLFSHTHAPHTQKEFSVICESILHLGKYNVVTGCNGSFYHSIATMLTQHFRPNRGGRDTSKGWVKVPGVITYRLLVTYWTWYNLRKPYLLGCMWPIPAKTMCTLVWLCNTIMLHGLDKQLVPNDTSDVTGDVTVLMTWWCEQ